MFEASSWLRRRIAEAIAERRNTIEITAVHDVARTIPPSRGVHVRGFHPVLPGHPQVAFESKLERDFISEITGLPDFREIRSQPLTVSYREDGRPRRYTPDFRLTLDRVPPALSELGLSCFTLIEMKPLSKAEAQFDQLVSKFAAIHAAAGLPIVILTDKDMSDLVLSKAVRDVA